MSAKLVFGWMIGYDQLIKYLEKYKVGSCKNNQCLCGPACWNNTNYTFPEHVYFVRASNFATNEKDFEFGISLISDDHCNSVDIERILGDESLMKIARKSVCDFGIDENDHPSIYALLNI